LVVVAQVLLFGFQAVQAYINVPSAFEYASAHDGRTELLLRQGNEEALMKITPLPSSGWLLSGDISSDSSHFTNQHLKLFFGLNQAPASDSTLTSNQ
jgi:hypothetical protein